MSRSRGRHGQPRPPVLPDTPEGDYTGESQRQYPGPLPDNSPIPGGAAGGVHITNQPTVRQRVPIPDARDEFRGIMAHGVPPDEHTTEEHAQRERGPNAVKVPRPAYEKQPEAVSPVPVYIVEGGGGGRPLRSSSPLNLTVQASTGEPVRLCGRDPGRARVLLLNEDTASNCRIAVRPSDLVNGGGALLSWATNSYLTLHTQDELYALSVTSSSLVVSVIQEFEIQGAGARS
jgi:hypothetical protein